MRPGERVGSGVDELEVDAVAGGEGQSALHVGAEAIVQDEHAVRRGRVPRQAREGDGELHDESRVGGEHHGGGFGRAHEDRRQYTPVSSIATIGSVMPSRRRYSSTASRQASKHP